MSRAPTGPSTSAIAILSFVEKSDAHLRGLAENPGKSANSHRKIRGNPRSIREKENPFVTKLASSQGSLIVKSAAIMQRILSIDHGDSRIGLAISDELGMLAHPLETIHVAKTEPLSRIAEIVKERGIPKIVLGMPYRMDGSEGTAVDKVREFRAQLAETLPEMEFAEVDERLTTVAAQSQLHAAGRKTRETRHVIDQAAAVVILQDYLDSQQGMAMLPPEDEDGEEE